MDLDLADTGPTAGRYVLPLTARWAVVAITPWPGVLALALFLDGEPVEVLDDPADVAGYLAGLPARWVGASPGSTRRRLLPNRSVPASAGIGDRGQRG